MKLIEIMKARLPEWLDYLPPEIPTPFKAAAHTQLFLQGDRANGVYVLVHGEVLLERITSGGDAITIQRAGPGDSFAEASVFTTKVHCTARVISDSAGLHISARAVLEALRGSGPFASSFCRVLARDVQLARSRAAVLGLNSARERLRAAFAEGQGNRTLTALAADIGLTPESVSRTAREMCRDGELEHTGRGQYRRKK